jgi:hypothetical protein
MRQDQTNGSLLSSWKEISEFLKCDVKTCRRWERSAGLPIHRVSNRSKSRVFAYREELDAWVRKRAAANLPVRHPAATIARRPLHLWPAVAILAVVILVALYAVFTVARGRRVPFDFRIEHSVLIILDNKERELWRYDTGREDLEDDAAYHFSFQVKRPSPAHRTNILPHLIIRDINNDGQPEVLFGVRTKDELNAGLLLCFDFRGRELWRFQSGRVMTFGSKVYSNDYMIHGIDTLEADGDGSLETMVIGYQRPDWPTQLVLLDTRGKIRGEYWNSGQLNDYVFADLDKDGRREIVLAGLNNEYEKGCVVVFSGGRLDGRSPQSKDEFICRDLNPGSETYYLLFPLTDVEIAESVFESVGKISLLSGEKIQTEMLHSGIFYNLDYQLTVTGVTLSHSFRQLHNEAVKAGLVSSVLDDQYSRDLEKGFLYYDGRGWIPNPVPVGRQPASSR